MTKINDPDCECTAILLQDIGLTGPEGPPLLRNAISLKGHQVVARSSGKNKSRTVAIILHASWQLRCVLRDESGGMLGAVIVKNNLEVLLVSAYLPATLDNVGVPSKWDASDNRPSAQVRGEAHALYSTLLDWTKQYPHWILGGDLK